MALPRKNPVEVTTHLIIKALRLLDEGITKPKKNYDVVDEIPKKGSMHHVKDVFDPDRWA